MCREAALAALEENIDAKEVCARHSPRRREDAPVAAAAKELAEVYRNSPDRERGSRRCRRTPSHARGRGVVLPLPRWELDEHL